MERILLERMSSSSASAVSTNWPHPSSTWDSPPRSANEDIRELLLWFIITIITFLESMLLRLLEDMEGELLAEELLDDVWLSRPAAAYQGITGARDRETSEASAVPELARRRRKLPFRLYMEVLRLRIRGMVVMADVMGCAKRTKPETMRAYGKKKTTRV